MGMFDDLTQKSGGLFDDLAAKAEPLTRTDKIIRGMRDPIDGGAQLLTNFLPESIVKAGNAANNWLADKTGLVGRLPEGGVDQQVREGEQIYQAQRKANGESGIDGYRMFGNVVSPANLALASRVPVATTLTGKVISGALSGGAFGALTPVGEGDFSSEKKKQVGAGMVTGGALPFLTEGAARLISPKASTNPNLNLLKEEGVNPTIGQTLGGRWNTLEEKMQSVPIMGDAISMARKRANTDFEGAAYNRALQPIGKELPPGLKGRDALNFTESTLKDSYDNVLNKIGAITPDSQFNTNVSNLKAMVNRLVMPKLEKDKFTAALSDIKQSLDENGVMTSSAYKDIESSLGTDARKLGASTNIYEGKLAPAVKQLQTELRDMLSRQAGQNADELKAVNAGWANFKRVQNAASKVGAENGEFNPSQFLTAVRTMDKSKDKSAFARGSALGQDLGDAGKAILGNKVPDSGTAGRLIAGGGALGSYFINPAIPASLIGGAAMYSPIAQRGLNALVSSRPAFAQPASDMFRQAAPALLPGAAQLGFGLLNY